MFNPLNIYLLLESNVSVHMFTTEHEESSHKGIPRVEDPSKTR